MARKKTITREQILNATYEIIKTEGFSGFTARNIANKMKCSTQPIYLEFKNMTDLKGELVKRIQNQLNERVFDQQLSSQPLIDAGLDYINFAVENQVLFTTLFVEGHQGYGVFAKFSYQRFLDMLEQDGTYADLSEQMKAAICKEIWIVATGVAALRSGQMISPTDESVVTLLKNVVKSVQGNKINTALL